MRSNSSKQIALGGVLAAVAVVIMCLGGLIPIATYVCPMLCTITQFIVLRFCGGRISWSWFAVVAILALLLSPDKEAAMVFLFVGYYPLVKQDLDKFRLSFLLKILFFNAAVLACYGILVYVLGMHEIMSENMELGIIGFLIILLLGNVTFFLLDKFLWVMDRKLR